MTDPQKPGYLSTEWWTTLLTQLLAVVAILHPGLAAEKWTPIAQAAAVLAAAAAGGIYAHGRAKVKVAATASLTQLGVSALNQTPPPAG